MTGEASFGWRCVTAPEQSAVEAEEIPGFGVARAWLSNGEYDFSLERGRVYVALTIEGRLVYDLDGKSWMVGENELIILHGGASAAASFSDPVVEFCWWLSPTMLRGAVFDGMRGKPIAVTPRARDALVSVTNSMLNHRPFESSVASQRYSHAMEELIAAALLDRPTFTDFDSTEQDGFLIRAQAMIEANFRDPAFNVEALSDLLHVSGPTLHRPYQRIGTTPRIELERRRVTEALKYMPQYPETSPSLLAETASSSGFRSTRHLQSALKRFREAEVA